MLGFNDNDAVWGYWRGRQIKQWVSESALHFVAQGPLLVHIPCWSCTSGKACTQHHKYTAANTPRLRLCFRTSCSMALLLLALLHSSHLTAAALLLATACSDNVANLGMRNCCLVPPQTQASLH
jgi:hypothetical protein